MVARKTAAPPAWLVYLRLGRVSNLPTVWSNCLAGATLALDASPPARVIGVAAAISLFYTAGMCLNDAFDAQHDRTSRPERPIPSGWVGQRRVMGIGLALLAAGEALLPAAATLRGSRAATLMFGAALAALILYYSWRHKRDPLSPMIMALCRACVYVIAASAMTTSVPLPVMQAAAVLAAYVIVLSYVAKWDLAGGRYIALLVAAISLVDAALIVTMTGEWQTAAIAVLAFPATLMFQRLAPGT